MKICRQKCNWLKRIICWNACDEASRILDEMDNSHAMALAAAKQNSKGGTDEARI